MSASRPVTNDLLYSRMDSMRLELKGDILSEAKSMREELADLRRQFEMLEAGRLTRLEGRMNDYVVQQSNRDAAIKQNQAVLTTKVLVLWGIANALMIGVGELIIRRTFK